MSVSSITPRFQANTPAKLSLDTLKASPAKVIRFSGENLLGSGKHGVWVTTERIPCKAGGFGEVSKTIPEAIALHSDIDLRIIQPYLKPMADEDKANTGKQKEYKTTDGRTAYLPMASEATNATINLNSPMGEITFRVRQKFDPALDNNGKLIPTDNNPYGFKGNVVYSLQDEDGVYERLQDLYYDYGQVDPNKYNPEVVNKVGQDPQFKLVMLFNRAAANILPVLNASHALTPELGKANVKQFAEDANFVIGHDWLSGPMLNELPEDYKAGKIFMLHNTFDQGRSIAEAKESLLRIPQSAYKQGYYSPLRTGVDAADVVIANSNYMKSITQTDFVKGAAVIPALQAKQNQNRVIDMHHALAPDFSPYNNLALGKVANEPADYGYRTIQKPSAVLTPEQAFIDFKKANKLALQREVGLKQDPNAMLLVWNARFDPNQKGFYMVMNTMERFMQRHPEAQFVLTNRNAANHPHVNEWIKSIKENPDLKGRVYLPNAFVSPEMLVRAVAGSDFGMLPSLYEPYGLTQVEQMAMATKPIVHGRDGLMHSVLDPEINGTPEERQKWTVPDASYGQTGIVMKPIPSVRAYQDAIHAQEDAYKRLMNLDGEKLSAKEQSNVDVIRAQLTQENTPKSIFNWELAARLLPEAQQTLLKQAQDSFDLAMERAFELHKNPDEAIQVSLNGMRYVNQEHQWQRYVPEYDKAIEQALKLNHLSTKPGSRFQAFG